MATKGPKSEVAKPVDPLAKPARKPGARAKKPAATSADLAESFAATVAEALPETVIPAAAVPPITPAEPVLAEPVAAEAPAPAAVTPVEPAPLAPAPVAAAPAAAAAEAAPLSPPPVPAPSAHPAPKKELTMDTTLHATAEKTQAMFADMNNRTKEAMEKSTKLFADMNEFAKGNVEAVVESSKVAMKAFESLSQEAADYTRRSFESATATMRTLAAVKTPAELMKLQSDFVRQSFDNLVAETSKQTEAMIKLAGDVAQPISNRVAVAAEKIKVGA